MTEQQKYDRLLKHGHVIDPANGLDGRLDVAVRAGKIARVAADIPAADAHETIDLHGLYVTPGLIDLHMHVYLFRPTPKSYIAPVNAEASCFSSGVTTAVDTGSAGWEQFQDFQESTVAQSKVRILAFLNIARAGMVDAESEQEPADLDAQAAAGVAQAFPETIVGIKSAHYWTRQTWDDWHPAWISVERAVEAGALCQRPVMVDFWPRPPERPYPELLLKKLRPGDIHTHVFAQQFPVLTPEGQVSDFLFEAREKGIRFDLGHGAASFWFRNAAPALRGGFAPDTLSTDLHMGNINGPVFSMAYTLSKFLNMGMPLAEVIRRVTVNPAQVINRPALGTLSPGAVADVAVFAVQEGAYSFIDCGGARLSGPYNLDCHLTLRAGEIVFNPGGLNLPEWKQAPPAYWQVPRLQA